MRATEKWREDIEKGVMPTSVCKTHIPESVETSEDSGVRKAAFVLSTADEDRDGDVIAQDGWDLTDYRKNPIVLFAHDLKSLPVAKATDIGVVKGMLRSPTTIFPENGVYPFADQVYGLVKGGFLRGTSVGFHPIEAAPRKGTKGVAFARQSLYEFSILPIPSNKNALLEAKSAGHEIGAVVKWAEDFLDYAEAEGIWVPKFGIQKALRLVLPIQVSVPAMPSETGGHAIAGAETQSDFEKSIMQIVTKSRDDERESDGKFADTGGGDRAGAIRDAGQEQLEQRRTRADGSTFRQPQNTDENASMARARLASAGSHIAAKVESHAAGKEERRSKIRATKDEFLTRTDDTKLNLSKLTPNQREGVLDANERERKRSNKEADVDIIKKLADELFGDQEKGAPPWVKEGDPKPAAPVAAPAPGAAPAAAPTADAAEEASPEEGTPADADAATEAAESTAPAPGAPVPGAQGPDALLAALTAEIEPLKTPGGDPTQVATSLKAALEKYAAAFMAQIAAPAAAGVPAAAPGLPGATPPQAPAAPPPPGTPPPPPGQPAAQPTSDAKPPFPPKEEKKGLGDYEIGGFSVSAEALREIIEKSVKRNIQEGQMHLTGKLRD